ncbi:MAG: TnpV protein, partial [Clostridia bacterium]|nr:TnpV protein [Clostridia bacterium]
VVLFILSQKLSITGKNELDRLIPILAKQQGVTEQLKAENQLKWVGLMNNIKAQVEEKIYAEIVYVRGAI